MSTPGGAALLESTGGSVTMAGGARIDVSGGAGGGSAGSIAVHADDNVELAGTLLGHSTAGGDGGSFAVQAGQLPDFASLAGTLGTGGFSAEQDFAVQSGDLILSQGTVISARNVSHDRERRRTHRERRDRCPLCEWRQRVAQRSRAI